MQPMPFFTFFFPLVYYHFMTAILINRSLLSLIFTHTHTHFPCTVIFHTQGSIDPFSALLLYYIPAYQTDCSVTPYLKGGKDGRWLGSYVLKVFLIELQFSLDAGSRVFKALRGDGQTFYTVQSGAIVVIMSCSYYLQCKQNTLKCIGYAPRYNESRFSPFYKYKSDCIKVLFGCDSESLETLPMAPSRPLNHLHSTPDTKNAF